MTATPEYQSHLMSIRESRNERIKTNPRNWLSLVGLFWLEEGENSFGSAAENKIVLSLLPVPVCGTLTQNNNMVHLTSFSQELTINNKAPEFRPLSTDMDANPDLIEAGSIHMMVIQRGDRFLLRIWDVNSQRVREFNGFNYYPIDPAYNIEADFFSYDPPLAMLTTDVLGLQHESTFLGKVRFMLQGQKLTLEVEDAEDEGLVSFVDETKNDSTYPGGRYLTLSKPIGTKVTLDFNLAFNWPCAYTPWATCPLPPKSNHLPIRIEAGELRYHQ